jgi:hypothetical protein
MTSFAKSQKHQLRLSNETDSKLGFTLKAWDLAPLYNA